MSDTESSPKTTKQSRKPVIQVHESTSMDRLSQWWEQNSTTVYTFVGLGVAFLGGFYLYGRYGSSSTETNME
jgi:hypothetical protein